MVAGLGLLVVSNLDFIADDTLTTIGNTAGAAVFVSGIGGLVARWIGLDAVERSRTPSLLGVESMAIQHAEPLGAHLDAARTVFVSVLYEPTFVHRGELREWLSRRGDARVFAMLPNLADGNLMEVLARRHEMEKDEFTDFVRAADNEFSRMQKEFRGRCTVRYTPAPGPAYTAVILDTQPHVSVPAWQPTGPSSQRPKTPVRDNYAVIRTYESAMDKQTKLLTITCGDGDLWLNAHASFCRAWHANEQFPVRQNELGRSQEGQ